MCEWDHVMNFVLNECYWVEFVWNGIFMVFWNLLEWFRELNGIGKLFMEMVWMCIEFNGLMETVIECWMVRVIELQVKRWIEFWIEWINGYGFELDEK